MNKFEKNIKNLTMTPNMWMELNNSIPESDYVKIVMDYQNREWQKLPSCKTIFGLCRNYCNGKCTKKGKCASKC